MRSKLVSLAALAALLALAPLTCSAPPPHGWSDRWGPLVPHGTFPADCSLCHLPDRWDRLRPDFAYDHAKETGVPLEGAHARAACLRCHNDFGPVRAYTERGCQGCHLDPHRAALGPDCTRCHGQESWRPGGLVAEHARTRFPLVGAHAAAACERCHERAPTGDFRGAPTRCEACHADDLAAALAPDHRAQGWTDRCGRCHLPTTWTGAGFGHAFFPLTGGHAGLACAACHAGGDYAAASPACFSCHADDYARAPNHASFPTRCESCHSTTTWEGARFEHRFPLSGPHAVACASCHASGTESFSCLGCHTRANTDPDHDEVRDYRYDSNACYACHPTGRH